MGTQNDLPKSPLLHFILTEVGLDERVTDSRSPRMLSRQSGGLNLGFLDPSLDLEPLYNTGYHAITCFTCMHFACHYFQLTIIFASVLFSFPFSQHQLQKKMELLYLNSQSGELKASLSQKFLKPINLLEQSWMYFLSAPSSFPWMLLTVQSMAPSFTIHPSFPVTEEHRQSTGKWTRPSQAAIKMMDGGRGQKDARGGMREQHPWRSRSI